MNKIINLVIATATISITSACSMVNSAIVSDEELVERASKALSIEQSKLTLVANSKASDGNTRLKYRVKDTNKGLWDCSYTTLGVVSDNATCVKKNANKSKSQKTECPEGYYEMHERVGYTPIIECALRDPSTSTKDRSLIIMIENEEY